MVPSDPNGLIEAYGGPLDPKWQQQVTPTPDSIRRNGLRSNKLPNSRPVWVAYNTSSCGPSAGPGLRPGPTIVPGPAQIDSGIGMPIPPKDGFKPILLFMFPSENNFDSPLSYNFTQTNILPEFDKRGDYYRNDNNKYLTFQYFQRLAQYLLVNGYYMILPGNRSGDSWGTWYSLRGTVAENNMRTDSFATWPGPDGVFIRQLIDDMYDGTKFGLESSSSKSSDNKLNMNKFVLGGWSAGASMVSRLVNEWPFMKTINGRKFPTIKAVWVHSEGSYMCL